MQNRSDSRIRCTTQVCTLAAGHTAGEMIDELYWTALSRPPTLEETAAFSRHLDEANDKRGALEDLTWALVNSKEFVMRY